MEGEVAHLLEVSEGVAAFQVSNLLRAQTCNGGGAGGLAQET